MSRKRVNLKAEQERSCPVFVSLSFNSNHLEKITLEESESFGLFFQGFHPQEDSIAEWFVAFLKGKHLPFPIDLKPKIGPFGKMVLDQLQKIPFGETMSYGDIAKAAGSPKGARAVGNACNLNPFPLVIPCHRVVKTGGALGGFAYGCSMKQSLLDFEKKTIQPTFAL